ncbi:MAG: Fe-S protein assembly co-chaperone HscB [Chitinophagales bacterium]
MKYFEWFGIPVQCMPDVDMIKQKYLQLSKQYHPDFYTHASPEKQAEILALSTLNNKAYHTLRDPDKRLQYILKETGHLVEEEKYSLPQVFLMEMMDLHMMVEELAFDPEKKEEVEEQLRKAETDITEAMIPFLQEVDIMHASEEDLTAIKEFYYKRKYLQRIRGQMEKFA